MITLTIRQIPLGADGSQEARLLLGDCAPTASLRHDRRGRPQISGGRQISISHTAGAVAVAIGDTPLGVDLERIRPLRPGLPRRVLGEEEYRWYCAQGENPADFFTLWTLKESYYKFLGTGLPGIPNHTHFIREGDLWRLSGENHRFWVRQKENLLIALCSDEQEMTMKVFES